MSGYSNCLIAWIDPHHPIGTICKRHALSLAPPPSGQCVAYGGSTLAKGSTRVPFVVPCLVRRDSRAGVASEVNTAPPKQERQSTDAEPNGVALWILAFALFFLLFACAAIVIGLHDVALPDADLRVTATSVVLLAFAAVLLVAARQLLGLSRRASWDSDVRPHGQATGIDRLPRRPAHRPLRIPLRCPGSRDQRIVVASVGLIFIGVAVAGLIEFGSEARVTVPRVGALALALAGATVSASQFWYQNEYAPSQAGRAVSLKAGLAHEATQRNDDVVRATVSYEAVSGKSLTVVGSAYTLTGSRVVRCDRGARVDASEVATYFNGFLIDPQTARFTADVRERQPSTVLAAGKFVGEGRRLEPKVPYVRQIVFYVPRGKYQLLRYRAQLFAISGSVNLSQRKPPEYELGSEGYLYGFWHVDDESWLRDLIYGRERWLVSRYELVRQPGDTKAGSVLRVTARLTDATWRHGRPSLEEAAGLFTTLRLTDPAEPFATTELPLDLGALIAEATLRGVQSDARTLAIASSDHDHRPPRSVARRRREVRRCGSHSGRRATSAVGK